jgi:hypothetical protein
VSFGCVRAGVFEVGVGNAWIGRETGRGRGGISWLGDVLMLMRVVLTLMGQDGVGA